MRVLVVGQGGREHALLWKLQQSKKIKELYCAPGNGGTGRIATNVPIQADDIDGLMNFCKKEKIDLTIVGPEVPLACGIVDLFGREGLKIFGPSRAAAKLEASKIFTKELCKSENIPTAKFEIFEDPKKAKKFIEQNQIPIVIKADGLCAGKGVIVASTREEALNAIDDIMVKKSFGVSGRRVMIEEYLEGEEASIIVISDGENIVPLASSQDYKRIFDGDTGANTGGMGAYSPAVAVDDKLFKQVVTEIIKPAVRGMKKRGTPHKGVLYAGIMITKKGPSLLEFNVRFGDPETQAILPRMDSDLLDLIEASINGTLKNYSLKWNNKFSVCIVMASGGYPGEYKKHVEISGIDEALKLKDILIFHAGTKLLPKLVTTGGRVLNVVGLASSIKDAIDNAYRGCKLIKFEEKYYRKDIGYRALNR